MMNNSPDKRALRLAAIHYRKSLTESDRQSYSASIIKHLYDYLSLHDQGELSLLVYRSLPSEVDTSLLFDSPGFKLFAPVTHHHEHMEFYQVTPRTVWKAGAFGVEEPSEGALWRGEGRTILLSPLTAFDRAGNRLGMGKGCFDFWLSKHRQQITTVIGLAFSGQEVAQIPAERHDVPMDCVVTEKGVVECQIR